jgi:hypothetical protein
VYGCEWGGSGDLDSVLPVHFGLCSSVCRFENQKHHFVGNSQAMVQLLTARGFSFVGFEEDAQVWMDDFVVTYRIGLTNHTFSAHELPDLCVSC